ncbi:MAG: purine nucleosidase, partial [Staphylococcus epidermidis]|nr:purine nucleosidase [Staphylococcus epidermidis]
TKLKIDVVSQGPSQGRTFQSENGREVQVITDVNKQAFFKYITDLAKKIET